MIKKKELDNLAERLGLGNIGEASYFPKFFQIETIRACNARCTFCTYEESDKAVPLMSDTLFNKIADEIRRYSHWIESVCLQRLGEPLIDKKIAERIRRFKQAGIKTVSLSTNASLLNDDKAREILEAGIDDVSLSIDSIDKEKFEKMRVGLDFNTVLTNIKGFFGLRDKIRPNAIIRVRGISFFDLERKEDKEELAGWEGFWSYLKKPQDRIYMKSTHNWGNQKSWSDYIPKKDLTYHPCVSLWSTMHINTNGVVPLCCMDYDSRLDMGDVSNQSIVEVWNSEKWNRVRGLHSEGNRNEIKFCRGCKVFDPDTSIEMKTIQEAS